MLAALVALRHAAASSPGNIPVLLRATGVKYPVQLNWFLSDI
jgi:hypothetical protein